MPVGHDIDVEVWIGKKFMAVYGSYPIYENRQEAKYRAEKVIGNLEELEEYLTKENKKKITIIVD